MKFCDNCKNKGAWCHDCMWNEYHQDLFEAKNPDESVSPYYKIQQLLEKFTRTEFTNDDYYRMERMLHYNYNLYEIADMMEFLKRGNYSIDDFVENDSQEPFITNSEMEKAFEKISQSLFRVKEVERELHCTLTKAGIDRVLDMEKNGFTIQDSVESFKLL